MQHVCGEAYVAGSEGIEPPIEVLETSVIPFNYEPNDRYCTKFMLRKELSFERLKQRNGGDQLLVYRSDATDKYIEPCFGVGKNKFIDRSAVFC